MTPTTTRGTLFWATEDPCAALEHIDIGRKFDASFFLHGVCGIFALALNEIYGYTIEIAAEENYEGLPWEARLVHVYCVDGDNYIDIRGVTDDQDAFFDEFADFLTGYDDEYFELPVDDLRDFVHKEMSKDEFDLLYQAAMDIIHAHWDEYKTEQGGHHDT